jgi:hypothetical protein
MKTFWGAFLILSFTSNPTLAGLKTANIVSELAPHEQCLIENEYQNEFYRTDVTCKEKFQSMIYDFGKKRVVYLNHLKKSFHVVSVQQLGESLKRPDLMKTFPEPVRELIQGFARPPARTLPDQTISRKKKNKTEQVGFWKCQGYQVYEGKLLVGEECYADKSQFRFDLSPLKSKGLAEFWSTLVPLLLHNQQKSKASKPAAKLVAQQPIDGFVVKNFRIKSGKEVSRTLLKDIRQVPANLNRLHVPENYKADRD